MNPEFSDRCEVTTIRRKTEAMPMDDAAQGEWRGQRAWHDRTPTEPKTSQKRSSLEWTEEKTVCQAEGKPVKNVSETTGWYYRRKPITGFLFFNPFNLELSTERMQAHVRAASPEGHRLPYHWSLSASSITAASHLMHLAWTGRKYSGKKDTNITHVYHIREALLLPNFCFLCNNKTFPPNLLHFPHGL